MAAARPVVLAIDGVIRDVVESAGCGIFVQPGDSVQLADALRYLNENHERSKEMGLEGRKYIEANFSREAIAGKLLNIFMKMTS